MHVWISIKRGEISLSKILMLLDPARHETHISSEDERFRHLDMSGSGGGRVIIAVAIALSSPISVTNLAPIALISEPSQQLNEWPGHSLGQMSDGK